jgi:hypothetical protein
LLHVLVFIILNGLSGLLVGSFIQVQAQNWGTRLSPSSPLLGHGCGLGFGVGLGFGLGFGVGQAWSWSRKSM